MLSHRGQLEAMWLLLIAATVEDPPLVRIRPWWGVFRAYAALWCLRRHALQRPPKFYGTREQPLVSPEP